MNTTESERLRDEGKIEDAIVELVRERDWVSFVEVERFLKGGPVSGNFALTGTNNPNAIFWITSEEVGKPLLKLIQESRVFLHPAQLLTYMVDGKMLQMPIAKRKPRGGVYKKETWVITCLRIVPLD